MTERRPTNGDEREPSAAPSTQSELHRSSGAFLLELANIHELETRKAAMAPDDPQGPNLARMIEDRVAILMGRSAYQRRLVDQTYQEAGGGIPRHPSAALHDWRDAEHRMMEARSALQRALEESERFQAEYRLGFARERDGA